MSLVDTCSCGAPLSMLPDDHVCQFSTERPKINEAEALVSLAEHKRLIDAWRRAESYRVGPWWRRILCLVGKHAGGVTGGMYGMWFQCDFCPHKGRFVPYTQDMPPPSTWAARENLRSRFDQHD